MTITKDDIERAKQEFAEWGHAYALNDESGVCPHCFGWWSDLWDYNWGTRETIEVECPHCNEPVVLTQIVTVQYTTAKRKE